MAHYEHPPEPSAYSSAPPRSSAPRPDITIPPILPARPSGWIDEDPVADVRENLHNAVFHGLATAAITGMLIAWTIQRGQVPALDPRVGVPFMVLHMGAWVTGWLSFEASTEAWRSLARCEHPPVPASRVAAVATVAIAALLLNTAMVVTAVLP